MPAPIGPEHVRLVANLARLDVPEQETDRLAGQLGRILNHFEELSQVDVTGVAPLRHPLEHDADGRADAIAPAPCDLPTVRANAPALSEAYFLVPPVLGTGLGT